MKYFFLEDQTRNQLPNNFKHKYKSFLILFEQLYYPTAFYFGNIRSMIIRTSHSREQIIANIVHLKAKHWNIKEVPLVYYRLLDGENFDFIHPETGDWISAEEPPLALVCNEGVREMRL